MIPFDEEGFLSSVNATIKPWLEENVYEGRFTSFDGAKICYYRALNLKAKAVIVMVHGFCEFFGKFHETAYDFWESGYTVYFIEQRGHGASERSVPQLDRVDVSDFSEYVEDLKTLLDKVVLTETQGLLNRAFVSGSKKTGAAGSRGKNALPVFLYAHSMGGCVSAMFLEKYPRYFSAAVLSSPMLKMTFGTIPTWQVRLLIGVSRLLHWNNKTMPGQGAFDPDKPDFEGSATLSRARFDYQWNMRTNPGTHGIYTMNGGTYRWGRAAWKATHELVKYESRIKIPVLVCQAGKDVFVDNEGQDHFVREVPSSKLVRFPEAKHEIYASGGIIQEEYIKTVLAFYNDNCENSH